MGIEGQYRLHPPTAGAIQEKRRHHRADPGVEKSVPERTSIRNEDAYLLHQSSRTRTRCESQGGTARGQGSAFKRNTTIEEITRQKGESLSNFSTFGIRTHDAW
jgi:hypothetical protein